MAIESEIRWGTGYDNALSFAYPQVLDNPRPYRRPVPGSRRARNPAGTTDAWIRGRDFCLPFTAKWFKLPAYGGLGLQDFLDWAGEGNTFRFLPDNRYPSFYVDNCYLDEPFDDPQPQLEDSDGSHSIEMVIRQQAFDFNLAIRGLMFEYVPGKSLTDPSSMLATFTRATTAYYSGRDGAIASVASGVLRDRHFVSGVKTTLIEQSSVNLVLQSDALATTWTASGVTPVNNVLTAAGRSFSRVPNPVAGVVYQVVTFTGNGTKAFSFFVKRDGSATGDGFALVYDTTASAYRATVKYTFASDGTITVVGSTGAVILGVESLGEGVYRVLATAAGVVAANTNRIYASDSGGATLANTLVSGVQAENGVYPSSLIPTTTGTVTRNADALSFPFAFAPQQMTIYLKFIEQGASLITTQARFISIGNGNPKIMIYNDGGGGFRGNFHNGVAGNETGALTPAFGETVELRLVLGSDGALSFGMSRNGGTETTAGAAAVGLPSSWAVAAMYIAHDGSGTTVPLACPFYRVAIAAGTKTMAEMRAA